MAVNYASRHMSWLHCMWGVGASAGPFIMGFMLAGGMAWSAGYRLIGCIQATLAAVLFLSLPLWKKPALNTNAAKAPAKRLKLARVIALPGVPAIMGAFFCYCALEQTAGLWAASYLNIQRGVTADTAAGYAGLYFLGVTVGRAISGFITFKFSDRQMIRMGAIMIAAGVILIIIPANAQTAVAGLILAGLGCAPVYPCIIHSTPDYFGADKSQAVIGVEMASAYVGICVMPPLFGLLADFFTIGLFPYYLAALLAIMALLHEKAVGAVKARG